MSRLHHYSQPGYALPTSDRRSLRRNSQKTRDERASLSGSEDGHYDIGRHDEIEEDPTLTSQTLNADGTPKRPMNAFMIFARRRRPQVSAENQALRTGDVSKLLSKEWASMPASEKQYYQEQAKFLKDSFNSKYPDYVYRRRPNNSRRRRRSDASTRSTDSNDMGGELEDGVAGDFDHSPVDAEDHFDGPHDYHNVARLSREAPVFGDPSSVKYPGRPSAQSLASDMYYRRNGVNDAGLPYPQTSDRVAHNMVSPLLTPRVQTSPQASNAYAYPQQSSQDFNQPQSWNPRMNRVPPLWSGGPLHQDRQNLDLKPLGLSTSESQWSNSPSSSTSSNSPNNLFATLNTPFNSNQHAQSSYKTVSSSSSSHYGPSSAIGVASSRSYDPRGTSILGMGDSLAYPTRSLSRELPPVHTIPGYSSQSTSSGGSLGPAQGYQWPRDFYLNGRNDLDLMSLKNEP